MKRPFPGVAVAVLASLAAAAASALPGDAVIRTPSGDSEIVITTTSRVAGAIHSLTWNGKEFIDSHDHGRQLQSASNFDVDGTFFAETFEALTGYMPAEFRTFHGLAADGSLMPLDDGPGEQSLSVILSTPDGSHTMGD